MQTQLTQIRNNRQKNLVFPDVPVVFKGRFPSGYLNDCKGWNFSIEERQSAKSSGKSLLTMDLDMYGKPSCGLRCKHCFNKVATMRQNMGELMNEEQIKRLILEAKSIGLRSIKIIGPGEPFDSKDVLGFLEFLRSNDIAPLVFTKGLVIGDDSRCRRIHKMGSPEFIKKIDELGVSILFGANSFDPETQARIVGRDWYPSVRNTALERLADAGFNDFIPNQPTRLSLIANPILNDNVDEIFQIYAWAQERNIYIISSPTMVSGDCADPAVQKAMTPNEETLFDLYVKINIWAIERGVFRFDSASNRETFDEYLDHAVSPYVGARQCQQVPFGLFARRDGKILRCPGDSTSVQGDAKKKSVIEIWENSENRLKYQRAIYSVIPYGCPPKEGKTIPTGFLERVANQVKLLWLAGQSSETEK